MIESCTMEDLEKLEKFESDYIECGWTKAQLEAAFENPSMSFLKFTEKGEFLAYVSFSKVLDEIEINNIAVRLDYRRKGIATTLIRHIMNTYRGFSIFLEVNQNNIQAIKLYEKLGFLLINKRKNYYGADTALIFKFV